MLPIFTKLKSENPKLRLHCFVQDSNPAYFYVWTKLQTILLQLIADQKQALGYKILVFISCSLAGRAYPVGEIPLDIVKVVKMEVLWHFLGQEASI